MIHNAHLPNGKPRRFKTLLTSACERDCFYCPFRAGRISAAQLLTGRDGECFR